MLPFVSAAQCALVCAVTEVSLVKTQVRPDGEGRQSKADGSLSKPDGCLAKADGCFSDDAMMSSACSTYSGDEEDRDHASSAAQLTFQDYRDIATIPTCSSFHESASSAATPGTTTPLAKAFIRSPRTAATATPFSSPRFSPGSDFKPCEPAAYIIYLEPSARVLTTQQITRTREYIGSIVGLDDSFLYPLHCSLTGFFIVEPEQLSEPLPFQKARVNDAIQSTVLSILSECNRACGCELGVGQMDPRRQSPALRELNGSLAWIKVTEDNGLVMPLDGSWFIQQFNDISHRIQLALIDASSETATHRNYTIRDRYGGCGIKLKNVDHLNLISPKRRQLPLTRTQALEAAYFLDQVFKCVETLPWDLVVYEVREWGDYEDMNKPHDLAEILRVPEVAVQSSLFSTKCKLSKNKIKSC